MAKKLKKKTPKKKSEKVFVKYKELINEHSNWGEEKENKKEAREMRNHPSYGQLQFAFLSKIVDLLKEIRDELKREKTIK